MLNIDMLKIDIVDGFIDFSEIVVEQQFQCWMPDFYDFPPVSKKGELFFSPQIIFELVITNIFLLLLKVYF